MSDQNQTLQRDIEYLKALARDGRDAPILGGLVLVVAGLSFGGASVAAYLLATIPGAILLRSEPTRTI